MDRGSARPCCESWVGTSSEVFWTQLNTEVTEETPILVVGAAALWIVVIFWRSWDGGEFETGRRLQGYGVSSPCGVDMVRDSS